MKRKWIVVALAAVMLTQAAILSTTSAFAKVNPPVIQNSGSADYSDTVATLANDTISFGDSAVVNASSPDDEDGTTYAVYYKRSEDSGWSTVQAFDENDLILVKPKRTGSYDICVKAKNAAGKLIRREILAVTVVKDFAVEAELSAEEISLGGSVTVSAQASGGVGTHQYAFFYKAASDEKWTIKQSYSNNSEIQITPKRTGDYQVCVKSKDYAGNIVKQYLDLAVVDDLTVSSEYESDEIILGNTITLTATASGGSGEYQYTACYKKQTDSKWTTIRAYGDDNVFTFKPAKGVAYDACVKVKDSNGIVKKDYSHFNVVDDMTVDYGMDLEIYQSGDNIGIAAFSQGGTGEHTYAFYYVKKSDYENDNTIAWTCPQHFEAESYLTLTPDSEYYPSVGDYYVCVKAMDENGVVKKSEYGEFTVVEPLEATCQLSSSSITRKNSVTVTAGSEGGYGDVQFAFYYAKKSEVEANPYDAEWTCAQDLSSDNTAEITFNSSGEYLIYVYAKDDAGFEADSECAELTVQPTLTGTLSFENNYKTVYVDIPVTVGLAVEGNEGDFTYDVSYKSATATEWKSYLTGQTASSFKLQGYLTNAYTPENMDLKVVITDSAGETKELTDTFKASGYESDETPFIPIR